MKPIKTILSRFSLVEYGVWTYVVCFAVLAIEIQTISDAAILLIWPIYGLWLFLKYFAWEMIAYDTVIPSWVGYMCFLFFIGWGIAIFGFRRKRIRNIVIILLILFSLIFISGCTYMTAALAPYGLI
jgi:hypothetical protein